MAVMVFSVFESFCFSQKLGALAARWALCKTDLALPIRRCRVFAKLSNCCSVISLALLDSSEPRDTAEISAKHGD